MGQIMRAGAGKISEKQALESDNTKTLALKVKTRARRMDYDTVCIRLHLSKVGVLTVISDAVNAPPPHSRKHSKSVNPETSGTTYFSADSI